MNMSTAVRSVFSNYVNFRGRARRSEFWYFALFLLLVDIVAGLIDGVIFGRQSLVLLLVSLAVFLPSLAVSVRRLHDLNKSGWWYLLAFIPLIGGLILLVWFCGRGTVGPNRYGSDPVAPRVELQPYVTS